MPGPRRFPIRGERNALDRVSGLPLRWGIPAGKTSSGWMPAGGGTTTPTPTGLAPGTAVVTTTGTYLVDAAGNLVPTGTLAAPANLRVTAASTSSLTVAWDAVAGATGYVVTLGGVEYARPSTASQVITGLAENTAYTVTVAATSSSSTVPTSSLSTRTTNAAPPAPAITLSTPGAGLIDVAWTVTPRPADFVRVEIYANGTFVTPATSSPVRLSGQSGTVTVGCRSVDSAGAVSTTTTATIAVPANVALTAPTASSSASIQNGQPARVPAFGADGDTGTYWLSGGRTLAGNVNYWQATMASTPVPKVVRVLPVVSCTVYVSLQATAGGAWQGSSSIPDDASTPGTAIPYVAAAGVTAGVWAEIPLPAVAVSSFVRISTIGNVAVAGYPQLRTGLYETQVLA